MTQHTNNTSNERKSFHSVKTNEREMTESEINQLLFEADTGRIGTIGENGPLITPLSFVFYNKSIYIHSRPKGKKLENIKQDTRVCFEVDKVTLNSNDNVRWKSVIIQGVAKQMTDLDEIGEAMFAMRQKARGEVQKDKVTGNSKIPYEMLKHLTIIKIEPQKITSKINFIV